MGLFDFLKRKFEQNLLPTEAPKYLKPGKKRDLLAELAKNNSSALIRRSATFGLNPSKHRALLADLSKNDKHTDVRRVAKEKLENYIKKGVVRYLNFRSPHSLENDVCIILLLAGIFVFKRGLWTFIKTPWSVCRVTGCRLAC